MLQEPFAHFLGDGRWSVLTPIWEERSVTLQEESTVDQYCGTHEKSFQKRKSPKFPQPAIVGARTLRGAMHVILRASVDCVNRDCSLVGMIIRQYWRSNRLLWSQTPVAHQPCCKMMHSPCSRETGLFTQKLQMGADSEHPSNRYAFLGHVRQRGRIRKSNPLQLVARGR